MDKIRLKYTNKRAHNLHYVALLVLLLFTLTIYGQNKAENKNIRIKHFTLEDGLSQVSNNDILQDSSGFVWIASEDGLNRFDGKEFKHFKYSQTDSLTISGNQITKLLEDNTGKIWVGTHGNGLNYYNPDLNIFHRIKLKFSRNQNESISDLTTDNRGNIWVASKVSGLHRLQMDKNDHFIQKNFLTKHPISALFLDQNQRLWIGDFNGHIFEFDITNKKVPLTDPTLNIGGQIRDFYTTDQHLLIASDLGLYIYNLQNKNLQLYKLEKKGELNILHISSFLKASESSVWIGTGSGLFLFDWNRMKVVEKIQYSTNEIKGLSNNTVLSLLRLSTEQILVGTSNYLNLVDFSETYFKNISKDQRGKHLLNDNVIFSIYKEDKDLWIGTSDGGLNLIRNDKIYYFKEDQNDPSSISSTVVRAIVKDNKNNRLWLGTTRGLSMIDLNTFDPDNPKFTVYHHDPNNPNTINMDFLKDLVLDKNNNIWGATYGRGIFRLEMSNKNAVKITRFKNQNDNPNSLKNNTTQCIRVDQDNNIWIGTQGGLTKLNFKGNNYSQPTFTNYYRNTELKNTLSHNSVYDILIDKKDNIWVATRNGLNLFLENNEFESWTEQKQFPNAVVYSIQDDENGNLWLGTNDGIVKFDTKNKEFKQFGVSDGIQSKEFDIHAKFRDSSGKIYLGGIAGVTYFQPIDLEKIDQSKPMYFSQFRVKDLVLNTTNSPKNLLNKSLLKTKNLEFKHNQFPFYLQFSSIDYRWFKNVEYAYKLLPTDQEWNELTDPEIQFLNLPAGSYKLQINGFSRGKEWNQAPLEMNLVILPPWYLTWWAYLIYAGIAIAFADRFYRFQLSKRLAVAESNRLKEVNHLKNGLYTNITHEFRTPLTVILGMADSIKSNIVKKQLDQAEQSLEMIERNGKNLLQLVNELLDLAKLESGNMELNLIQSDVIPFVKYLSESLHSLAQEKKINLTVYSEIDQLMMDFDANKLSAVISNVLSNAIKFTPSGGKIIVHLNKIIKKDSTYLKTKKEFFLVKIVDNGLGISEKEITNIFNRFYQVDNSSSRQSEGAGIGLALTKEFVELMHGTITVKSTLEKGSEFTILFPVTNNALQAKDIQIQQESPLIPNTIVHETNNQSTINSELPLTLIIEDNVDVAHYLKTCMIGKYQTMHALNGEAGIEMAIEKLPDIIICDVMMPGKNGFEVCSILKADERTDHIPIIILTAKVTMKDRITGLSCGADAYLTKPFVKAELFTRLDQLVLQRNKMMQKIENENFSHFIKKPADDPETKFLQKLIKIIHSEMNNHSFGLAFLSHKMHLSESQIYRKLKAITGKSTAVFIRFVRLQKAKEMIQTTDKTISEIAYDVGFNDPSWFSRAFKEEYGFAPSAMSK